MQVYCIKSGVLFQTPQFDKYGVRTRIEGVHPIFEVPRSQLINLMPVWAKGEMSQVERKLFFLALLNSTGLVEFRHPAFPADGIVQHSMERLLRFIAWYCDIRSPQLRLPRFAITRDTASLVNIRYWLEKWEEARNDWEAGYIQQNHKLQMFKKEAQVSRLLKSTTRNRRYYRGIAQWAMEAGSVPRNLRDYWISLFLLEGFKIFEASQADLDEMVEHFETHLDAYDQHMYASAVLEHVRKLRDKNLAGLNYGLGLSKDQLMDMDFEAIQKNPYAFADMPEHESEVETQNRQTIIANYAPVSKEELKPENFPNYAAFIRAKAAMILQIKQQERQLEQIKREQDKRQTEILAVASAEETQADLQSDIETIRRLGVSSND